MENTANNNSIENFKDLLTITYSLTEKWDEHFLKISTELMNNFCIITNGLSYRIVECEVYYYSSLHPDIYTYQGDTQLKLCTWYFHDSGMDITFGHEDKDKFYGGILIRGIREIGTNNYINGPLKVREQLNKSLEKVKSSDDIFSANSFYIVPSNAENVILQKDEEDKLVKEAQIGEIIISTTRYHLSREKMKIEEANQVKYKDKKYRFIAEINSKNPFKDKTLVASDMFETKKYTTLQINKLFWKGVLDKTKELK